MSLALRRSAINIVFCSTTCIHCKGGVSLTNGPTWSDPGQVSADYHGGQHDSNETKNSCNRHKLLVGRQRRASAKHGGTAHAHAPALSADARPAHVQCRTCHFTTTRSSRSVISLLHASVSALPTKRVHVYAQLNLLRSISFQYNDHPVRHCRWNLRWSYIPYSSKCSWHNIFVIFVINTSFTKYFSTKINSEIKGRGVFHVFTKFCSNYEIFTTKIKTFANLERFTKFLCHENLELYGIQYSIYICDHARENLP